MKDLLHEKFAKLMEEIESLETEIDSKCPKKNIDALKEELIEKRNELKRLSNGCGHP